MKTIKQTVTFDASPHEIYEMLMDSKKHAHFTGDAAKISKKVGGKIQAYGDYIEGKNLELVQDKKIVQEWRASDWPKDVISIATFEFKKDKDKTKLTFTQTNVPEDQVAEIKKGWIDFYWILMKEDLK